MNGKLFALSLLLVAACDGGSDDPSGVSSIISPAEGGSLSLEGSETGLSVPEGAVASEVELSLSLGSVNDYAANENALEQVMVFDPEMSLEKPASMTFELAEDFDFNQRVHLEQFVDGVWLRPEVSGLEIGSGGVAYGTVFYLAPTAIVVDVIEPS